LTIAAKRVRMTSSGVKGMISQADAFGLAMDEAGDVRISSMRTACSRAVLRTSLTFFALPPETPSRCNSAKNVSMCSGRNSGNLTPPSRGLMCRRTHRS